MKKKPTFIEWLKDTPKQLFILVTQVVFILGMFTGLCFDAYDMEIGWVIFSSAFLISILWLCVLRTYSIYTNLLRIDWFK